MEGSTVENRPVKFNNIRNKNSKNKSIDSDEFVFSVVICVISAIGQASNIVSSR